MTPRQSERTNVIVANVGLALVLVVVPMSSLMAAAVLATMLGVTVTYRLTADPLQVSFARSSSHRGH